MNEIKSKTVIETPTFVKQSKCLSFIETGISLGKGKHGSVDLIIFNKKLRALKRISKLSINN